MQIRSLHFRAIQIPLKFQFKQSNNSGTSRSLSAIIALHTATGAVGYGESCPRTYVTGEQMTDVASDLARLEPELLEQPIGSITELKEKLEVWEKEGIGASTRCAFELAWIDAWSRSHQLTLPQLLDIQHRPILSYSTILPLVQPKTLELLLEQISGLQPPALKLKVNEDQESNLAKVRILQERYGADIPIRVDVNAGWSLDQAKACIPAFLKVGVHSFEQAVNASDLESMQELTRLFGEDARIMADESLLNLENAGFLLKNKICNHFNLKISKLGGIFSSLKIYRLAQDYGVPCQLGAHFGETSLLTAAGALLAALVNGELSACEGAMGEMLLSADIGAPAISHSVKGELRLTDLWQSPGLTQTIRLDKLEMFSVN